MKNEVRIIVNSDDFGISNEVNRAIVTGMEEGLISSTTMMASMPGFEDAVQRAQSNPVLKNRIGLHMNLTQGVPLTDEMKRCKLLCNGDHFTYDRKQSLFRLSGEDRKAVYSEIKAQLSRLTDNGITPTHLDSHHHVHTEFGIMQVYLAVAREFGIRKMRLTRNLGNISTPKKIYKGLYNAYIRTAGGMRTTNWFCGANDFNTMLRGSAMIQAGDYEVMVHAKWNDKGTLIDLDGQDYRVKMKDMVARFPPMSFYEL
jgi:chitin disaccharide deacetylase